VNSTRHRAFLLTLALLAGALAAAGAGRTVLPTWLHRHVPDIPERAADVSTPTCHYRPIFGAGDSETRVMRGVARFGEVTIDAGGSCQPVNYPREEQVYVVTAGAPAVSYDGAGRVVKKLDYMYLPPAVGHGLSNPGDAPAKVLIMGWRIPAAMEVKTPPKLMLANVEDVPLQVVGNHPPSTKYRLLMGDTTSKRDRLATGHVLTSLFLMEFTPGGTNFPHAHANEEEFYLLLSGRGDIIAGGGMDGVMGRHPARPGDAYFYRLNCTVGFYASTDPQAPKARILAARSRYPRRR